MWIWIAIIQHTKPTWIFELLVTANRQQHVFCFFFNRSHFFCVWFKLNTIWFHHCIWFHLCNTSIHCLIIFSPTDPISGKVNDKMATFFWPIVRQKVNKSGTQATRRRDRGVHGRVNTGGGASTRYMEWWASRVPTPLGLMPSFVNLVFWLLHRNDQLARQFEHNYNCIIYSPDWQTKCSVKPGSCQDRSRRTSTERSSSRWIPERENTTAASSLGVYGPASPGHAARWVPANPQRFYCVIAVIIFAVSAFLSFYSVIAVIIFAVSAFH